MKYYFTPREKQVLNLLVEGYSNPEISEYLNISIHTTKAYLASIYRKLGVMNRVQATVRYLTMTNNEFPDTNEK